MNAPISVGQWTVDDPAPIPPDPGPTDRNWSVLATPGERRFDSDAPVPLRRIFLQLIGSTLVVLAVVAVGGSVVARRTAEQQGVHDAATLTDVIATSVVQPQLTDAMLTDKAEVQRAFVPLGKALLVDRRLQPSRPLVRLKMWTPGGKILWSDESRLVGGTYPLDDEAKTALTVPQTSAAVSDLGRPENVYERNQGRLLEVYRPVWTPGGEPLLMEAYYRYDDVTRRSTELWRGFSGIMVSSLLAVLLLLTPIVWTLAARTRRAQAQREAALQRAADGSLDERRRIAGELHDGMVQELAGAAFSVAAQAETAANRGDAASAKALRDTAATVRSGIGGLRALLVDLYPPNLRSAGLPEALRDVAATLGCRDARVATAIADDAVGELDETTQQVVFRVAQEALRNAAKHSHAELVRVTLDRTHNAEGVAVVRLEVEDDGVGHASGVPISRPDSFGLRLMTDQAESVGALLAVRSAPGAGTTVRLEIQTGWR